MGYLIESNLEFYEVLNAFPVLKDKLEKLDFNVSAIKEGITVYEYFQRKSYSEDEIDLMIKKLNSEIRYFLKNNDKNITEKEKELLEQDILLKTNELLEEE